MVILKESTILHLELIIYGRKEQSCSLIRIRVLLIVLILQFIVSVANQMNVKIKKVQLKDVFQDLGINWLQSSKLKFV